MSSEAVTVGLLQPFGYGLGYQDWVAVTQPAAGQSQTVTVTGENYARVLAARASLTTDANAANRLLTLDFINARGTTFVQNGASVLVTANTSGQVFEWDFDRTVSEWNTGTPVWAPVVDVFLPPGFSIKFNLASAQVGDQLSSLVLWLERFPTGARGYPQGMVRNPDLALELLDA